MPRITGAKYCNVLLKVQHTCIIPTSRIAKAENRCFPKSTNIDSNASLPGCAWMIKKKSKCCPVQFTALFYLFDLFIWVSCFMDDSVAYSLFA